MSTLDYAFAAYLLVQVGLVEYILRGFRRDAPLATFLYYIESVLGLLAWVSLFANLGPLPQLGLYGILFAVCQFGVFLALVFLRLFQPVVPRGEA